MQNVSRVIEERDNEVLIERARGGDADAFYDLVSRYERGVYWAAFGILGNSADAEDITQETFLKSFQHLDQYRAQAKFSTWLIQIAVNEALLRLRRIRPALYQSLDSGPNSDRENWMPRDLTDWRDNPEEKYAEEELRRIVMNAVESLAPIYRTVLIMRDLQQMSNEEVASTLRISVPAVKTRLLRARLQLREMLTPKFKVGWRLHLPWRVKGGRQ